MATELAVYNVEGMSCEHCVMSIKKAVGDLKGVEQVEVDLKGKRVTVDYDDELVSFDTIRDIIEDQGYKVR